MAKLKTAGTDELIAQLESIGEGFVEASTAVLQAEAKVYVQAWQDAISGGSHVRTGSMMETVEQTGVRSSGEGNVFTTIYPQGTDGKGVRNALKAYVTNYGRRNERHPHSADRFVEKAEKQADGPALSAGEAAFDAWLSSKGV